MLNGVTINKSANGLGKQATSKDMIMGLIMGGVATTATSTTSALALNTPVKLLSVDDATSYGIDAAYDTTNSTLVYHHISEFFRTNENGQLWIMLVARTTTLSAMVNPATANMANALLIAANGEINVLGVVRNPATTYTATLVSGLDSEVSPAITMAQTLADAEWDNHRPLHIVIEGRSFNGSAAAALDLRTLNADSVSCIIAQDKDVAATANIHHGYAAVGVMLGLLSAAKVSENIGWVEKFPINDVANGLMVNPSLSSYNLISSVTPADYTAIHNKGYIMPRVYADDTNVYLNDDHTCAAITNDYSQIVNNRTINKAAKGVYKALLPQTNGAVPVEADGTMAAEFVSGLESKGEAPLDEMKRNDELSAKVIYINPAQNVVTTSKVAVKIRVIPMGCSRYIDVDLGLTAKIS
jgi:uncharacterized membrane protein